MNRNDGAAEVCREYLGLLLRAVTVFYVLMTGVAMPLYYKRASAYGTIGSDKAGFFQTWGIAAAKAMLVLLPAYAVFCLFCRLRESRKQKGRLVLLFNELLDTLSLTDKFACFYTAALCLSYYYTAYRDTAWLGTDGWYMGFLPQLCFLLFYFCISRFTRRTDRVRLLLAMSAVSFVVFLLGILNRFGVNPLGMTYSGPDFISTIGNINWYCGYWSVLFPLSAGVFLFCGEKGHDGQGRWKRPLAGVVLFTGFATGLCQGSDSGILTLLALLFLCGCLSVKNAGQFGRYLELLVLFCGAALLLGTVQLCFPERNRYVTAAYRILVQKPLVPALGLLFAGLRLFWKRCGNKERNMRRVRLIWQCLACGLGIGLFLFFLLIIRNTTEPGSIGSLSGYSLFTFNEQWGSSRGATWTLGVQTWLSQDTLHRFLGVGPDCMAAYIYGGSDEALLAATQASFGNHRLTNAHGELLSVLVNMGVLGLIGFAGMVISGLCRFLRRRQSCVWCAACGLGIFCYLVNNLFSFWQIMNISQMFLVLGLGEGFLRNKGEKE